jgi:hypothetical protein
MADFTLLATPTDSVLSVNGQTGAVTVGDAILASNQTFTGNNTFSGDNTFTGDFRVDTTDTIELGDWNGAGNSGMYLEIKDSTATTSLINGDFNIDTGDLIIGEGKIQITNDLQISKTSGNNSIIEESGTGDLILKSNNEVEIASGEMGEYFARFTKDAGVQLFHDNNKKFETTSGGVAITGTLTATGDVIAYYSSDKKYKDNIEQLDNALDKVKQIRGVRFDWNDKQNAYQGHDIGVIAQEVEAVYPELVRDRVEDDSKAVDYVKLSAVLIEAVKELSAKVEELENKIK